MADYAAVGVFAGVFSLETRLVCSFIGSFFGPLFYGGLFDLPTGIGRDNIGPVDTDPTGGLYFSE